MDKSRRTFLKVAAIAVSIPSLLKSRAIAVEHPVEEAIEKDGPDYMTVTYDRRTGKRYYLKRFVHLENR